MPSTANEADTFSIIQLWDPDKNQITVETRSNITQTIQVVENTRIRKGQGSAAHLFNFKLQTFEFTLDAPTDVLLVMKIKDYKEQQYSS